MAAQLEPYVRSLTPAQQSEQQTETQLDHAQHLATLLEHIGK